MSLEKAIAAALEPLVDDVVALERYVAALALKPGPKGEPGADADAAAVAQRLAEDVSFQALIKGKHGRDGAGIDAPHHVPGRIYREGSIVLAYLGQHFVAQKDTAGVPGESGDWRRVGSWGFRHRGQFDKDASYTEGDIALKEYGAFVMVGGQFLMLCGRGERGKIGEPGARGVGAPGKDGRDGSTIIGASVQGFKLVLVQQNGDGSIDHLEADFTPAYRELMREAVADALPDVAAQLEELRDEIATLKRNARRAAA